MDIQRYFKCLQTDEEPLLLVAVDNSSVTASEAGTSSQQTAVAFPIQKCSKVRLQRRGKPPRFLLFC